MPSYSTRPRRRPPYVPIVDNSAITYNLSDGSSQGYTYKDDYRVLEAVTGLEIVLGNVTQVNGGSDPITVRAAILPNAFSGIISRIPVLVNGQRDIPIDPGGLVTARIEIDLPADSIVTGWWYVSVATSGEKWPLGVQDAVRSATNVDQTDSGTPATAATEGAYHPLVIRGVPANPAGITHRPVLAFISDSILAQPPTSSYASWLSKVIKGQRATALADVLAIPVHLANPGEGFPSWTAAGGSLGRAPLLDGVTHAVVAYGVNDLQGRTAAQIMDDTLTLSTSLANRGIKVFTTTITPVTGLSGGNKTNRDTVNTYRLAGLPIDPTTKARVAVGTSGALVAGDYGHPVVDVLDVAAAVETAPQSNTWADAGYTGDGTHPSDTGSTVIAAAVGSDWLE